MFINVKIYKYNLLLSPQHIKTLDHIVKAKYFSHLQVYHRCASQRGSSERWDCRSYQPGSELDLIISYLYFFIFYLANLLADLISKRNTKIFPKHWIIKMIWWTNHSVINIVVKLSEKK